MEEKTDGERKITPSIPANYISILQLRERWNNEKELKQKEEEEEEERRRRHQAGYISILQLRERWNNEKERKQKEEEEEEEERRRRQQAEEQQRIEEDLKKAEVKRKRDEKRLNRNNRKHWGRNSKKKESFDGGEARCAEEEPEVTVVIGSERGEDAGLPERKRRIRKRYDSKKKKNQDVAAVKEDVVDECGSIAPPECVVTENNTPAILVYRKKREKATGKLSVGSREKAITDDKTAIETQFEDLSIKSGQEKGETKNLNAQTSSRNRNRINQRHDLPPRRIGDATMVWVKKEPNEQRFAALAVKG